MQSGGCPFGRKSGQREEIRSFVACAPTKEGPCENTARKQSPSASQGERPQEKPTLPTL